MSWKHQKVDTFVISYIKKVTLYIHFKPGIGRLVQVSHGLQLIEKIVFTIIKSTILNRNFDKIRNRKAFVIVKSRAYL